MTPVFKNLSHHHFSKTGFRIEGVMFNPKNGAGATANHQDVFYFGFVCTMFPQDYLRLAKRLTPSQFNQDTLAYLNQSDTAIAPPWLRVEVLKEGFRVTGHEGRHRAAFLHQALKGHPIPVYIHCGNTRAKELEQEWLEGLPTAKLIGEEGTVVNKAIRKVKHMSFEI